MCERKREKESADVMQLKGILLYATLLWSEKEMRSFFTEFLERIPLKGLRLSPPQLDFLFRCASFTFVVVVVWSILILFLVIVVMSLSWVFP